MHAGPLRDWLRRDAPGPWHWGVGQDIAFTGLPDRRKLTLRPDQCQAADAFHDAAGRGVIVMPTGTGKTVVAIEILLRTQASVLIVVPVRDLMYQWHAKILQATGTDAGLIGDGVHRVSPISVSTYDSAAIHMSRIGDRFEMIIFDEVHHLAGSWRADAARMSAARWRLGLTATPPTDPDRLAGLNDLVGPVVHRQSIAGAAGQTLAAYKIKRIAVAMTQTEQTAYRDASQLVQQFVADRRELDSTFIWEQIHAVIAGPDVAAATRARAALIAFRSKRKIEEQAAGKFRVLEDLFRLHFGEPVIVFCGSNVMARAVSLRFLVPCLLSHCAKKERREYLEGFAAGRYPVLVANRVLDEGVDLPEVKVAIVLGGTASGRQATQRLGRVLRRGGGNQTAVLYEVVTAETGEVIRSRTRRRGEAYQRAPATENRSAG